MPFWVFFMLGVRNGEPCFLCLKNFECVPRVVVSWYCSSSGAYQFNGIVTNLSRELTVWTYMSQLSGSEQFSNFGLAIDFLVAFVGCSWLEELDYFEKKTNWMVRATVLGVHKSFLYLIYLGKVDNYVEFFLISCWFCRCSNELGLTSRFCLDISLFFFFTDSLCVSIDFPWIRYWNCWQ
jgi:hypothetical protein